MGKLIYYVEVNAVSSVLNITDRRDQTGRFRTVLRIVTGIGVLVSMAGMVTRKTRLKDLALIRRSK